MQKLSEIDKLIRDEYPLYAKTLNNLLKPSIGIKTVYDDSKNIKSLSKFGGAPDVYKGFKWPEHNGTDLTFIAQLYLEELKDFNDINPLPKNGMLYFFILTKGINRYPSKKGEYRILYSSSHRNELIRYSSENIKSSIFLDSSLNFYRHYTFPSYQEPQMAKLNEKGLDLDHIIEEVYEEICLLTGHKIDIGHQLFGNPQAAQGSVKIHWSINKFNLDNPINEQEMSKIFEIENEFELLLQLDFEDENLNFDQYGGSGVIYFGITKNDLKNLNFDDCVLCIQST